MFETKDSYKRSIGAVSQETCDMRGDKVERNTLSTIDFESTEADMEDKNGKTK